MEEKPRPNELSDLQLLYENGRRSAEYAGKVFISGLNRVVSQAESRLKDFVDHPGNRMRDSINTEAERMYTYRRKERLDTHEEALERVADDMSKYLVRLVKNACNEIDNDQS